MSPRTDALPRRACLIAAVSLALSGCQDHLARRDSISAQAGDALAANRAIHVVDPWPSASANTDIPTSGRKVVQAIERYERGSGPEPAAPVAIIPAAPPPVVPQ